MTEIATSSPAIFVDWWRVFYPGERVTRNSGFVAVSASDAPVPLRC